MKLANASKLNRKSGVRCCERGAPVRFPLVFSTRSSCGHTLIEDLARIPPSQTTCEPVM
jgi:hypothetical protein